MRYFKIGFALLALFTHQLAASSGNGGDSGGGGGNTLNSGTLTTSNGNSVTSNGNWQSGGGSFKIDWSITQVNPTTYNYSYSITSKDGGNLSSNLNYIILELGSQVTQTNLSSLITNMQGGTIAAGPFTYSSSFNSNIPGNIYGIRITTNSAVKPTFTFTSSLAPIWGEFFAQGTSGSTYAYNTDFSSSSGAMKLAIPGSGAVATPEPSTYVLMGSLLFLLGFYFQKKRSQKIL